MGWLPGGLRREVGSGWAWSHHTRASSACDVPELRML